MQIRRTTKELLADSLLELSEKNSLDKIKIKDITDNCGLTPTTFYNHFHDKYDLTVWIYSVQIEKIVGKIFEENYKLRDSISDCIKYYADNKKFLLNAITHTSGQNSFINNMTRINLKVFLDFIKINNGLEEIPKDIEILSKIYVYGTVCVSYDWLIDKNPVEFEKFIELLEKSLPEKLKKYFYKKSQA